MSKKNGVLDPWIPVQADIKENIAKVKVWGREYTFDNSMFPTAITTAKESILAAPMKLRAFFKGNEVEFTDVKFFKLSESDEKVVFQVSQNASNLIVDGRIIVEYDGFIKLSFSLIPHWQFSNVSDQYVDQVPGAIPTLNKLYLDIPVKKEFSDLYHYWPNAANSIIPDPNVISAGALPENGATFGFKPYIWAGWCDGGIGICQETDQNIEVNDKNCVTEFITENDKTIMRIHLLDDMPKQWQGRSDEWINTLKPIDYTIGIEATPVKPYPQDLMDKIRFFHGGFGTVCNEIAPGATEQPFLDSLEEAGVKWLIFHEEWSRVQNYGLAQDDEQIKACIKACHERGIKVLVYFGYEYSTLAPDWYENATNYLIKTTTGQYTGGWQRKPHQRAFMACYEGGYAKVMQDRVKFVMDVYGADGIYTDGTFIPWECANENHGCGYRDENGELKVTFPIFAVREHVKELYSIVHERGGHLDTHQSSACIAPLLGFCDSYYDGENIQKAMRKGMEFLSLDSFRAEFMGKNLGIPTNFLASTKEPDYTIQKVMTVTLLHDVFCRPGCVKNLEYISKIWKIFSAFETNNAKWFPYWDAESPVKISEDKVYCSSYKNKNGLLLVVSNTNKEDKKVTINIGENVETAEILLLGKTEKVSGNSITVDVPTYDPQIILVK